MHQSAFCCTMNDTPIALYRRLCIDILLIIGYTSLSVTPNITLEIPILGTMRRHSRLSAKAGRTRRSYSLLDRRLYPNESLQFSDAPRSCDMYLSFSAGTRHGVSSPIIQMIARSFYRFKRSRVFNLRSPHLTSQ